MKKTLILAVALVLCLTMSASSAFAIKMFDFGTAGQSFTSDDNGRFNATVFTTSSAFIVTGIGDALNPGTIAAGDQLDVLLWEVAGPSVAEIRWTVA